MSSWLLRAALLFCQGTPCSKDTDGVCEALLLEPSPWQKKVHWNPKSEWHIDMQHEICWPRHASCQEANAQRNVVIHVISCYSECNWKFHVNAPSGQRELLVAVRLFCLMCVPCKVRSANKFLSRKREKENRAPHVFFNFAPGYTLTDCLLSCSVQSSKIPTLLRTFKGGGGP